MDFSKKKIILASASPRRRQLLTQAGFQFEVRASEVDETIPDGMSPEKAAIFLAIKKARAIEEFLTEDEIILAADSIVVLDNVIYGKPVDYGDAVRILKELSGKMHEVITGVCLLSKEKEKAFAGFSKVWFEQLNDEEIDYYITNFQPYDKAGAYAVQEWIGLCKISRIEGTFANIMGLPVDLVYRELGDWGIGGLGV
jgi:septum formation protein